LVGLPHKSLFSIQTFLEEAVTKYPKHQFILIKRYEGVCLSPWQQQQHSGPRRKTFCGKSQQRHAIYKLLLPGCNVNVAVAVAVPLVLLLWQELEKTAALELMQQIDHKSPRRLNLRRPRGLSQ